MAQVLIRQLDDHVVAALRPRAQAQGLSLEQSLRDLLTATAHQGHALRDELAQSRMRISARLSRPPPICNSSAAARPGQGEPSLST